MKNYIRKLFINSGPQGYRYVGGSTLLTLGLCSALTSIGLPSARAASATWTGGADGLQTGLNVDTNWSTGSAAFVSSDVVTFDNTTPLGTTLVWSAQFGPSFGATDGVHINYTGAGNLTLNSDPDSAFFGLGNITIASGAGTFTLGDGGATTTLVFRGANGIDTFTNNSANTAVMASDVAWRAGGGGAKTLNFEGSGNWRLQSGLRIDASQGQSPLTVNKNGAGTLELAGANNFGGSGPVTAGTPALNLNQGTISVTGAGSFGTSGVFTHPIALGSGTFNFGSTSTQTFSGVISGSAAYNQSAGNVTLTGVNTFSGPVTVTGGTLALGGAGTLNSAGTVIVNGATAGLTNNNTTDAFTPAVSLRAGTLAGTGVFNTVTVPNNAANTVALGRAGAETLTVGSLAFQGATNLTISKVAATPTAASVTVTGALTTTPAAGKVKLNASLPFWTSAQFYNLIHAGTFTGSAADFQIGTVSGLTSRQSATVSVQGTDIGIMINGDTPRWTGGGNATWDTTSTGNWSLIVGGGATTFLAGDVVRFDDTASNPAVSIAAAGVAPASTQFANETLAYTLSGPGGITAGSLIKDGAGSLTISSANTYTGGTIINAGTVTLSGSGTLGAPASPVTVNGGTLDLGAATRTRDTLSVGGDASVVNGQLAVTTLTGTGTSGIATVSAVVGGTGSVVMNGAGGTLTLAAANTYTGGTTVTAGTLALSGVGTLGAADANATVAGGVLDLGGTTQTLGTLTMAGPGTVQNGTLHNTDVTSSHTTGTAVVAAALTGDGSVTSNAAGGVLALSGTNTYTGATTATLGTLQLGNGGETGSISPASPITVAAGAVFAVNRSNAAVQGTDFGTVTGAGGFTKSGTGVTTLNTANTYAGTTTVLGGTLEITDSQALGTGSVNINGFGNRLHLVGGVTLPNLINTGGGVTVENVSGDNTLNGGFEFGNVGSVSTTITSTSGTLTLNGNLTIASGLSWSSANRTFDFAGAGTTIVNGVIAHPAHATTTASLLGLNKNGSGTVILNGVNTYSQPTFVYNGVLRIDGALAVNPTTGTPSTVTAEYDLGTLAGTGTIAGPTGIYGWLRPAAGGTPGGQLTFENTLYIDQFGTTQFDFAGAAFTGIKSTLNNGLTYGGVLRLNFTSGIYNGSYTLFEFTGTPSGSYFETTLTTTVEGETNLPLSQNGSVWSITTNGVSYAFDQATGVLTVSGATDAVIPGSTTLSAAAGTSVVNLDWTAAANADTYVLRRSTTAGGPYVTIADGLGGLSYSDTDVVDGTTYYYVVMGKDSSSNLTGPVSAEVSATPEATPYTALQTWRFDTFGVYDDDGTILAGDAEDFDGDGLANLLEYALGTDATAAGVSPVSIARSGDFLTLTYPRNASADPALSYVVEASNDLTGFAAGPGTTSTVGDVSTYTDTVSLATPGLRRFLRLSVTYTPAE